MKAVGNGGPEALVGGANKADEEFIRVMYEIERSYSDLSKHEKIRVEQWTKKLCQITTNMTWKLNRNLYARLLLDFVLKKRLEEPFSKMPPDGPLPTLNKTMVMNRIGKGGATLRPEPIEEIIRSIREDDRGQLTTPGELQANLKEKTPTRANMIPDRPSQRSGRSQSPASKPDPPSVAKKGLSPQSLQAAQTRKIVEDKAPIDTSVDKVEMQEYVRVRAELDLAKISDQGLRNELNIRITQTTQQARRIEQLNEELRQLREQYDLLYAFTQKTKHFVEANHQTMQTLPDFDSLIQSLQSLHLVSNLSPYRPVLKKEQSPDVSDGQISAPVSMGLGNQYPQFFPNQNGNGVVIPQITQQQPNQQQQLTPPIHQSNLQQTHYLPPPPARPAPNGNIYHGNLPNHNLASSALHYRLPQQVTDQARYAQQPQILVQQQQPRLGGATPVEYNYNPEMRNKIQKTDQETREFMNYLADFQRDNEKLKKEAQDLLARATAIGGGQTY
eukprot:TRINITY_DN2467_c0_g10_i1.p1 TRINITY_DN2467_c0_g10~~TRINITY_DN2467_c0_g10_i1.p1  ORF type:complete len:501 (-),score=103.81 TRINITY_DN2467_c0_g10_i1:114-1616(-)